MDWQQFLGLGAVAAIVTAVSNFFSAKYFSEKQQKQSADFDAMRLAVALDRFAYDCATLITDEQTWRDSSGAGGRMFYELPNLTVPEDIAWKSISLNLADKFFALENDLLRAGRIIGGEIEYASDPNEGLSEPSDQAGLIGYRAHVLSWELRAKYQPNRKSGNLHPWDYVRTLKSKHDAKVEEYKQLEA